MTSVFEAAVASRSAGGEAPRALMVFAHPDDETIALGARMGRFRAAHMMHVTDGAPKDEQDSRAHGFAVLDEYRRARQRELDAALKVAGAEGLSRECLDIADQEASLRLAAVSCSVWALMEELRPEVIFTHPYEGGHPDHDACAFAVHAAVELVRSGAGLGPAGDWTPLIVEAPFYHEGPEGFVAGRFAEGERGAKVFRLGREEREVKQKMLDCFTTQREVLRGFPPEKEMFREAPQYDFSAPPNGGRVWYERFPWGMTSARFCALAAAVQEELQERVVVA